MTDENKVTIPDSIEALRARLGTANADPWVDAINSLAKAASMVGWDVMDSLYAAEGNDPTPEQRERITSLVTDLRGAGEVVAERFTMGWEEWHEVYGEEDEEDEEDEPE